MDSVEKSILFKILREQSLQLYFCLDRIINFIFINFLFLETLASP